MLLVVDKLSKRGQTISQMAHIMGFISYSVTPYEIFREISPFYSAILMVEPSKFNIDREYFEKITRYNPGIPLFALCSDNTDTAFYEYFNKTFVSDCFSTNISEKIINYANDNNLRPIGKYCGYGFQASPFFERTEYFEEALDITRTETIILRLLLRVYPATLSAADILKYAFRPGRRPEISSIKTHISLLNKRCRLRADKNVIEFVPKAGYVLSVPAVKAEYALYENLI